MTAPTEPPPRNNTISQKSPAERLTGVADPKPAVKPARKRTPKPKAAPKTITFLGQEWDPDVNPDGYFVATELAAGESE